MRDSLDLQKIILHLIVLPGMAFVLMLPLGFLLKYFQIMSSVLMLPIIGAAVPVVMMGYAYLRFGLPKKKR